MEDIDMAKESIVDTKAAQKKLEDFMKENAKIEDGQKRLEEYMEFTMIDNNVDQKELYNGQMEGQYTDCNFDELSITFEFPTFKNQANRVGALHGGAFCGAFDMTITALARFCAGSPFAPTISLDVKYIRPIQIGDTFIVKAKATATGKRVIQIACEGYSKDTGKLAATASSVCLAIDTTKEKRK